MTSLTFHPRVPIFDANVRVGDLPGEPAPCRDRTALLAELDRYGVARAVIYHALTEEISPVEGNILLETWLDGAGLSGDDRLVPQWSVLPTEASLAQVQARQRQGRVSSVRLHDTRVSGLPFRPWAYDELLSWLSAQRIPIWIPLPGADADELLTTLQGHPDLVTVLIGAHYIHHLQVRPLLRRLPNAYLELSRYEPLGDIEALRAEYGADRLVYGSWYSQYALGPMLFYLHHTDLSEEELAIVCAGNLERILRRVTS
jgi:predicted TIM-barrel fold metal-dependent hydrolase